MSNTSDHDLIEAHIASGQPRYSNTLHLLNGGFIRRWSDDRDDALAQHARSISDANLSWTITFDHLDIDTLAVDFPPNHNGAEPLRAACDKDLDAMIDRWEREHLH